MSEDNPVLSFGTTGANFTQQTRGSILKVGPGQQGIPKDPSLKKLSTSFGAKLPEIKKAGANNPGPGSQTLKSSFGEGPRFSILGKIDNNTVKKLNSQRRSRSTNVLKTARTDQTYKEDWETPGPGDYNVNLDYSDLKSPRVCFGQEKRFNRNRDKHSYSPGPCAYEVDPKLTLKKERSGIFNKELRWIPKTYITLTPGPGNQEYDSLNVLDEFQKSPSCIFGTSQRAQQTQKEEKNKSPGPCDQSPRLPLIKNAVTTIGKKSRMSIHLSNTPGPAVQEPLKLPRGIGVRFRTSIKMINKELTPGPTQYKPIELKSNVAGGSMGKSERQNKNRNRNLILKNNVSAPNIFINKEK